MITKIEFIKEHIYSNSEGAIKGYDPVAYFTESKAIIGEKDISYKWKDANWYFASKKNRDVFIANPKSYAPQFGGYCAFAVSEDELEEIDPESWKIVNGKLYLNYDLATKEDWESDQDERIKSAESNWSVVSRNEN